MEEKHKCKVCWKSFVNGRALGGHMRSHMLTLPLPCNNQSQLLSTSSSSSSSAEKRVASMADHECVLQDRESETESSKKPTRKRSKLNRRSIYASSNNQQELSEAIAGEAEEKMMKTNQQQLTESCIDQEPMSSVSDTAAAEEDVAFSLMMLSRDKWGKKEEEEEDDDEIEFENWKKKMKKKKCFKCETCDKVFKSYQALGGHRASHKKNKASETPIQQHNNTTIQGSLEKQKKKNSNSSHECPICFKVFTSGQALGGHKRSHATATTAAATVPENSAAMKRGSLIDLNLPAPSEDEDLVSAVFNA